MDSARIIAFLSDFGTRDYYVGAVKAVVHSLCPQSTVVDVTHEVEPWSVEDACYILRCCYDDFPSRTVFLVVVDPGVGTSRKAIILEHKGYLFVGPDNGLLPCAVGNKEFKVWEILRVPGARRKTSHTFHGRDVFAPVAAFLSCGGRPEEIGREYADPVLMDIEETILEEGWVKARVVHVDRFGNVALGVRPEKFFREYGPTRIRVAFDDHEVDVPFVRTFGDAPRGSLVALVNSCGYLELAVNMGNASEVLGLKPGRIVKIKF